MAAGGIAKFQFSDYRINQLSLWCSPKLDVFVPENPDPWDMNIGFVSPQFHIDVPMYVGGLQLRLEKRMKFSSEVEETALRINASIIGQFPLEASARFPEDQEQMLAKVQIPAILFPYLRSAVSTLLVNAGFNKVVLPLINLHQIAKESADKIQIIVMRDKKPVLT